MHQLLAKLVNQGLNLQAHTAVSSVSSSQDKKYPYLISTPRGNIQATKVVHATNAYASSILPEYTNAITPVRGVCCHIESPQGTNTPHLVNTYGIRFDKVNNDYLVPRADGSIIVGGARQAFWHQKDRWFDNVQDNEIVGEAVPYFSGYMQRHFRGWEDSQMKTTRVWTGSKTNQARILTCIRLMIIPSRNLVLGYSSDFMPHIGEVPEKPGQFVIAGFTGYGMPKILLSSKGLAAMVRDGCSFEQTGLPGAFQTSKERNESKTNPMKDSFSSLWTDSAKL